ncbi:SRPBCC family protein [Flavobacterium pallidum]|uniref:ATPase n=1 Tax=Flavobacterium pallidum TaxID=2172098 RepID=A0A2S1SKV4_9FLAO|nr:SRPBCC family protein [Flavobacterium pallidum]AWI26986.1 ATPase [Flavobacterium pallidum]
MATNFFQTTPDCEIVTTRVFNFPKALLFEAWSNPRHLKNWWGPEGFTNTFHEFDFREGGKWDFTMHGPEKGNYNNLVEFLKIEEPNLIAWKRHSQPLFNVQATFEEISAEEARLTFRMIFETATECEKLKKFVVDKNEENFDRLQRELQIMVLT